MRSRVALVILIMSLVGGRAYADDAKLARQHFEDGSRLYDLGKFRDAAREYEEAYKYKPDPALLFNIGQAYRAAGDAAEAVTAYKSYLRRVPDASNRQEVEGHVEKLQRTLDEQKRAQPVIKDPVQQPTLVTTATSPPPDKPLYKKWWLWTAVGGVVVAGGVIAIAVAATTPKDASSPANTFGVSLH